jgi:hypothetical protein
LHSLVGSIFKPVDLNSHFYLLTKHIIMSYPNATNVRRALYDSRVGLLPAEVRWQIEDDVPLLRNANAMNAWRLRAARKGHEGKAASSFPTATGDPTISPKYGSPFLNLPPEVRRIIFTRYLLPEKAKNIEPNRHVQRREAYLKKRSNGELAIGRARALAQNAVQLNFQGANNWNVQLQLPLPALTQQAPVPVMQPAPPPPQQPALQNPNLPLAALQPFQHHPPGHPAMPHLQAQQFQHGAAVVAFNGAPPPTANPLHGWTGNPHQLAPPNNNHGVAVHNHHPPWANPPPPAPNLIGMNFGNGAAAVGNHVPPNHWPHPPVPAINPNLPTFHNFVTMPGGLTVPYPPQQQQLPPPLLSQQSNSTTDEEEADNVAKAIAESRKADMHDATPENLVTKLLTTNVQLCLEVSTILYEEYTFEMHIHPGGVEFLHFNRIPTLETWGLAIDKTMGAFKTQGHFCFHRMKHLEFVFFGGDPQDRLAGLRMRECLRKLISFIRTEREPLTSLKVRFEYEQAEKNKNWDLDNAMTDEVGNFWSTAERQSGNGRNRNVWRDPRSSILHKVFNVQLVCAPLKALRNVSNVKLQFPGELRGNEEIVAYGSSLEAMMKSQVLTDEAQDEIMREEMMMDARRDKELEQAGAGGYYKQAREVVDLDQDGGGFMEATKFLMDENEVEEEDGLVEPFGASRGQQSAAQHHGDDFEMEVDSDFGNLTDFDMDDLNDDSEDEEEEDDDPSSGFPATLASANSYRRDERLDAEEQNRLLQELEADWEATEHDIHRTSRIEEPDVFGL